MPRGCLPAPDETAAVRLLGSHRVPPPVVPGCCGGDGPLCGGSGSLESAPSGAEAAKCGEAHDPKECEGGCAYLEEVQATALSAEKAMGRLRAYAGCMTRCEIAQLCSGGGCCRASSGNDKAREALRDQLELLKHISLAARTQLEGARQQLGEGQAEAAARATTQVALVARDVQLVAEQKLEALSQSSARLRGEASALRQRVAEGARNSYVASRAVAGAPGAWHFAEAEKAVRAAMLVEELLAHAQKQSIESRRLAREVDNMALDAVQMSTEAAVHVANASGMALEAVEQAAQNSMTMKAITEMIKEVSSAK